MGGVAQPEESVAIIFAYVPAQSPVSVYVPAALVVIVDAGWGDPPKVNVSVYVAVGLRPLNTIVPSQAPQSVGLVNVPVIEVPGLMSIKGPTGGVTHALLSVAIILAYVPGHRPVSVYDPAALVVTTTGGCGEPPIVYVTV